MRIYTLCLMCLLASHGAVAGDMKSSLRTCAAISSDSERLGCFDALASDLEHGKVAEEPAATVAHTPEELESKYGKEHWESELETPKSISSAVSAVRKNGYGKLVVTLANDQVWQQSGSETVRIAVNDKITIERGALSSFFFRINDGKRKIRFKRIR